MVPAHRELTIQSQSIGVHHPACARLLDDESKWRLSTLEFRMCQLVGRSLAAQKHSEKF